jgi:hypothetical protein
VRSVSPRDVASSVCLPLRANRGILVLGIAALIVVSLVKVNDGLWLDELITAWVVRDRLEDLVIRATTFQGQSPFYFFFPWVAGQVFGFHEWSLRLPSIIFNLCTVVFFYGFLRRLRDSNFAACGAGALAAMLSAIPPLYEARPYALGVCCFVLSLNLLIRWALSGRRSEMLGFVVAAMGTFYAHYLFAIAFPLYGVVLIYLRRQVRLSCGHLLVAAIASLVLALPAVWQLYLLTGKARLYSYSGPPTLDTWAVYAFRDQSSLGLFVVTVVLYFFVRNVGQQELRKYESPLLLGLILWLYPGVAVAVVSLVTGIPIFVHRYFIYGVIGEGLVQAVLLSCTGSSWQRIAVFIGLTIFSMTPNFTGSYRHEDWKEAVATIPSSVAGSSVVLLWPGLCEARDISWIRSSEKRDYLLSPFSFYPVKHPTLPIPYYPEHFAAADIFSEKELSALAQARRIYIIAPGFRLFSPELTEVDSRRKIPWINPHTVFEVLSVKKPHNMIVIELEPKIAEDPNIGAHSNT